MHATLWHILPCEELSPLTTVGRDVECRFHRRRSRRRRSMKVPTEGRSEGPNRNYVLPLPIATSLATTRITNHFSSLPLNKFSGSYTDTRISTNTTITNSRTRKQSRHFTGIVHNVAVNVMHTSPELARPEVLFRSPLLRRSWPILS